jgi:hypothetical protein
MDTRSDVALHDKPLVMRAVSSDRRIAFPIERYSIVKDAVLVTLRRHFLAAMQRSWAKTAAGKAASSEHALLLHPTLTVCNAGAQSLSGEWNAVSGLSPEDKRGRVDNRHTCLIMKEECSSTVWPFKTSKG